MLDFLYGLFEVQGGDADAALILSILICLVSLFAFTPRVRTTDGGNALSFDGSNDFVTISGSSSHHFGTGDFAIEMWVKRTGTPNVGEVLLSFNPVDSGVVRVIDVFGFEGAIVVQQSSATVA